MLKEKKITCTQKEKARMTFGCSLDLNLCKLGPLLEFVKGACLLLCLVYLDVSIRREETRIREYSAGVLLRPQSSQYSP